MTLSVSTAGHYDHDCHRNKDHSHFYYHYDHTEYTFANIFNYCVSLSATILPHSFLSFSAEEVLP